MSEPSVVDARGTRCPMPVVAAARASRDRPDGTVLVLLADDDAARTDVPAWARIRGHTVEMEREESWTRYVVTLGGHGSSAARST